MAQVEKYYLPDDFYYDRKEHVWARIENGRVRVGIDMFAQQSAGTIAYIKMLPVGRTVRKGRAFGSIEAGKYIGPVKAPVNGRLAEVNQNVLDTPKLINDDPYGEGWLVVVEPSNLEEDLTDLVHGAEEIEVWLEAELKEYREKGLIEEDD